MNGVCAVRRQRQRAVRHPGQAVRSPSCSPTLRVLVLAALVLLISLPATAQQATQAAPTYRTLVDGYRRIGMTEIERMLTMPRDAIEASASAALSPASGWTWEDLRGAAMLHTDVALRALASKDRSAALFHLALAERLLDRTVSLKRPQEDFVWRWYAAMPQRVKSLGGSGIENRLDAYVQNRWGQNRARMLYLRGLEFEWRGANEDRITGPGQSLISIRNQAQGTWTGAAKALVEALKEDPSLHGAALHLGRIRMLQARPLEASPLFRSALTSVDPAVAYLAALFLGSLEEREERFAEAEALYRDALARIPYGQAAPLALAQLLSRTGREAEARDILAAGLLRPRAFVVEPMWAYGPPDEDPATQIDLLRMEVWK